MIAFRYICRKPPRFKYNIVNYVRFTEQRFRFKVNIWHESIQVKPIVRIWMKSYHYEVDPVYLQAKLSLTKLSRRWKLVSSWSYIVFLTVLTQTVQQHHSKTCDQF